MGGVCSTSQYAKASALGDRHQDAPESSNDPEVLYGLGVNKLKAGDADGALALAERCLHQAVKTFGAKHVDTACAYNLLGYVWCDKRNYEKAIEFFKQDLEVSIAALGPTNANVRSTYVCIGDVYCNHKGDYDEALLWYEKAYGACLVTVGANDIETATTFYCMGNVFRKKRDWEKAVYNLLKSLSIRQEKLGPSHKDTAVIYSALAFVYDAKGDIDNALLYYEKDVAAIVSNKGANDPAAARAYRSMRDVCLRLGDTVKAGEYIKKEEIATLSQLRTHGDLPESASATIGEGDEHFVKREFRAAAACYEKCAGEFGGWVDPIIVEMFLRLGQAYNKLGDGPKAVDCFIKANDMSAELCKQTGKPAVVSGHTLRYLAEAYERSEKFSEALATYTAARDAYMASKGPSDPETVDAERQLLRVQRLPAVVHPTHGLALYDAPPVADVAYTCVSCSAPVNCFVFSSQIVMFVYF